MTLTYLYDVVSEVIGIGKDVNLRCGIPYICLQEDSTIVTEFVHSVRQKIILNQLCKMILN